MSAPPESPASSGVTRWLRLDFGVLLVLMHLGVVCVRGGAALQDPSTGWHLAAGRMILEAGAVPREDAFSFTAAGAPWRDYYWLFQLASGWLERAGGLPLVAAVWMAVCGLVPFLLYRTSIRSGASPLAAFVVVPVGYMVLVPHALVRPHVVTYVALAFLLGRLVDVSAGRRPATSLWWVPFVMVGWANAHGGFMSGLAAVSAVAVVATGRWVRRRDAATARGATTLAVVAFAAWLATLLNPYGIELHLQAVEHLTMPSTSWFDEFRSPDFRGGTHMARYFELLVLAVIGLGAASMIRTTAEEVVLLLGTLSAALTALRDMNLFVLVAVPMVARAVTAALAAARPALVERWRRLAEAQARGGGWRVQLPLAGIAFVALGARGALPFPTTLDGLQLSRGAFAHLAAHPERFQRAFNTIGLGGHLTYRFWPARRVFVDDRTVVYGEEFVSQTYLSVLLGHDGWGAILAKWGVTSAIVSTWAPCFERFRASPEWHADYVDDRIGIFVRRTS